MLDICVSPILYPYYQQPNDTVIIVDILRATTTICMMFRNGVSSVIPIADVEDAKRYKKNGFLVGAERNAQKCNFADFGNSPFDYPPEVVSGREIAFTTTNGTQAIHVAQDAKNMYIGAFSNIDALVRKCAGAERVVVVCAGWNNRINVEDTLFGGAFAKKMVQEYDTRITSDAVKIARDMWQMARENPLQYIQTSEHYARLAKNGIETEAAFCLQQNTACVVPYYVKSDNRLHI